MGVDANHIQLLLSTTSESLDYTLGVAYIPATRANIVNTLLGLSTNVAITKNDNILILFSGHGASYKCEDYYSEQAGIIEALCPADRDPANGIPDISDRELSTILAEICRTKGHHITVILDCCHASRDVEAGRSMALARQAKDLDGLAARVAIEAMFTAANTRLAQLTTANGSHRYQSVKRGIGRPSLRKPMYSWQHVMPSKLHWKMKGKAAWGPTGYSLGHFLMNSRRLISWGTLYRLIWALSAISLKTNLISSRGSSEIIGTGDFGIRYDISSVSFPCMGAHWSCVFRIVV